MAGHDAFWAMESTKGQPWEPRAKLPRFYQPFTTRTPWLLTILAALLACIASLEIAFNTGLRPSDDKDSEQLVRRQQSQSTPSPEFTILTTDPATTDLLPDATTTISTSITPTSPTTTTRTTSSSTSRSTTTANSGDVSESADPGDFLTITSDDDPPQYATPGDFLIISEETTVGGPTTSKEITAASADPGSFLTITTTSTPTGPATTPARTSADAHPTITSPSPSQQLTVVTITEQTSLPPTMVDGTSRPATSSEILSVVTVAMAETTLKTTDDEGRTTVISTSTTIAPLPTQTQGSIGIVKASQIQIGITFTHRTYFASTYLGVLIAVGLKVTWGLSFSGMKLMEPFYQLAQEGGATASESLLADYLSAGYSLAHIKHIFTGHWVMLFSSIAYLAMAVLSPLAAEAMSVVATDFCPNDFGTLSPCAPVWVVNLSVARGLEAVLATVAVLVVLVVVCNWPRKSGIFSNPSSIASMASLLSHEDMLQDLRQLDQRASDKSIALAVSATRYTMMSYELSPGSGIYRYGVTKTTSSLNNPYSLASTHNFDYESRHKYAALSNPSNMYLQDSHPIQEQKPFSVSGRLVRDTLFLCCLIALFGIVLGYYLEGGNTAFNRFFNSGTFGPKFVLTSVAALVDFQWKTLEREVRIVTPYLRLHARNADARHSVVVDVGGVPIYSIWTSLSRGEIFHSTVAFAAILSDGLIIAIAGIPFSSANVREAFLISSYVSLAIIGFMILLMLGMLWWRLQVKKLRMPREPDTILAVWLMLCDPENEVRKEYNGWESTRGGHRDRAAQGRGAKYFGGWTKSLDSVERWSVGVESQHGTVLGYR